MIHDFIESGLEKIQERLHRNQIDRESILNVCREMNSLLNKVDSTLTYEEYIANQSPEIAIRFKLFFHIICSKYACPNLWPLMENLMNFQARKEIHRPDYRDHVLHSVQNVLLGFALIGHDALFVDPTSEMSTIFMALAYHDLGYIEQIISPGSQQPGFKPVLETFFKKALESVTANVDLVTRNMHLSMLQSALCLNPEKLDQLGKSGVLGDIANRIWATETSYEDEHLNSLFAQIQLESFPFKEYKAWKEKDKPNIPPEQYHSLASAMLLFKIVSTRKIISERLTSIAEIGDPLGQSEFSTTIYRSLRAIFLHDFNLSDCPATQQICDTLGKREIFVISVDEFQTYGRPSHSMNTHYLPLNPNEVGYRVAANRKIHPQISFALKPDITDENKPAYYHTNRILYEYLQKKIGMQARDFLGEDEFY